MLAFFSIIVEPDGSYNSTEGSLHNPPPDLRDVFRINQYAKIPSDGWTVSEFGYLCLRRTDQLGRKYLLPGLYLEDGPKPSKKFHGYKPGFRKEDIETYLNTHLERIVEQRVLAEQEMTTLVHDLRHLSTAIYHSAEQADRAFRESDRSELAECLKTIVATQTMLKARINYLDYVSGVDRFEIDERVPVYSRVDKVVRCFDAAARNKNIFLRLSGQSFRLAQGPNILEIVPYTIIDNAIKYSPRNSEISVRVYDVEGDTVVSITSLGPLLPEHETEKIFERGFRGQVASQIQTAGTGIGLSVAKDIVTQFSGKISARGAGDIQEFDGNRYHEIEFRFSVPSSGEDTSRKQRATLGRLSKQRRTRSAPPAGA
jgi:signal transduction histidine kinase